eukprot:CAMPEP_0182436800 /NCGR_PEP_ID=MMETSP1167-20130531/83712_1 /TAXON_ID=2988 /ORGANISM="Mallomonas Sp, Strain CCMP3275" /LENGTH=315 /DNA_ID=CAMNT_0024629369 /DNA_START=372 /DNA_END=1319 /DNA_ORIENTATION=+
MKQFQVTTWNHNQQQRQTASFDYVICCTGHFSTPNIPHFSGMDSFPGRVLHAHDFRNAEEFTAKNILIIGTSYSAEDIASQCFKYGAQSITLSYRTSPMSFQWPKIMTTVPLLERVNGKQCTFIDGTVVDNIDAIILCTGYRHSFPFMSDELRLVTSNRLWCDSLYEGIVWPKNPKLMYLGMQDQWFTFNMFDAQAWYARDVILNRITLPDRSTMEKEFQQWRNKEMALNGTDEAAIFFQAEYVIHLLAQTNCPSFDAQKMGEMFVEWEHNKHENIMTFRDCAHVSVISGTPSPVHPVPWLQEFDDTMEHFLKLN